MTETEVQPVGFLDPEFIKCPFPTLKQLREAAPVMFIEPMNMFMVLGYEAAREVLTDPARFSSKVTAPGRNALEAQRIVDEEGYGRSRPALQNNDAPRHTQFRKLVDHSFRPKRIRQMSDYVDGIVAELIDGIIEKNGETDIVQDVAVPLPLIVISDQLGVPREEYRTFKKWSDAWLLGLGAQHTDAEMIAAAKLVVEMQKYLVARIEERRTSPREDILSDLATAKIDGAPLDVRDILGIVEQLLVAGNETTTNGIAAGLLKLTQDQQLFLRLKGSSDLVGEFTEEILRTEAPVQALFRRAVEDAEIAGVAIPKDATLVVHYGSANRDAARFDAPDKFDLDRPKKGLHFAFGSGIHHCVGAELARVEMRAAFKAFVERFDKIELLEEDVAYHPTFALRGIQRLTLQFTALR
jgi:cytochrome P450